MSRYKTADGSIWKIYPRREDGEIVGERIDSPNNTHERDSQPYKLAEILQYWGALSLYDSIAKQVTVLTKAFEDVTWFGCRSFIQDSGGPRFLYEALDAAGYEIKKKES